MSLHKLRRNIRYIKNLYDYDFNNITFAILQNKHITMYHNRFNIYEPNTVISKFNKLEFKVYNDIGNYGMYGGTHLLGVKLSKLESTRLKCIIRWRLKNYYTKNKGVERV